MGPARRPHPGGGDGCVAGGGRRRTVRPRVSAGREQSGGSQQARERWVPGNALGESGGRSRDRTSAAISDRLRLSKPTHCHSGNRPLTGKPSRIRTSDAGIKTRCLDRLARGLKRKSRLNGRLAAETPSLSGVAADAGASAGVQQKFEGSNLSR